MYSRSIIPNEFNAPTEYITEKFVLRPLTIEYAEEDYEVVMSSVDHLYKLMDNSEWPKGLSLQENLIDLGWHQREFTLGHSFAYTVLSPESNKIIGCCYIYPSADTQYEVQVFFWIKENLLRDGLEPELGITIKSWLEESWPFKTFDFPGRNI